MGQSTRIDFPQFSGLVFCGGTGRYHCASPKELDATFESPAERLIVTRWLDRTVTKLPRADWKAHPAADLLEECFSFIELGVTGAPSPAEASLLERIAAITGQSVTVG